MKKLLTSKNLILPGIILLFLVLCIIASVLLGYPWNIILGIVFIFTIPLLILFGLFFDQPLFILIIELFVFSKTNIKHTKNAFERSKAIKNLLLEKVQADLKSLPADNVEDELLFYRNLLNEANSPENETGLLLSFAIGFVSFLAATFALSPQNVENTTDYLVISLLFLTATLLLYVLFATQYNKHKIAILQIYVDELEKRVNRLHMLSPDTIHANTKRTRH